MARPAQILANEIRGRQGWAGAAVAERTKGAIRLAHPTIPGRFAVRAQAGVSLHYGNGPYTAATEVDTAWEVATPDKLPYLFQMVKADYHVLFAPGNQAFSTSEIVQFRAVTGEAVGFQPQQLQWINNLDQIQPIATQTNTLPTLFTEDYVEWATAYGPGLPFRWINAAGSFAKRLTITAPGVLPAPTLGGTVELNLQFIFVVDNDIEIWAGGQQWNKRTETRSSLDVEFRKATGELLWRFARPKAWDSEDNHIHCDAVYKKQGNSLIVQVRVPHTWIASRTAGQYPLYVDPTVDLQTASSAADASELADQSYAEYNGSVIEANADSNQAVASNLGAGWVTSGIDSGDTVDVAYMEMYVPNASLDDLRATLYFNDVDDAVNFNSDPNIELRTLTTASVVYDTTGPGVGWYGSGVSIVSPFQEVVDRAGFAAGNVVGALLLGDTSGSYTRSWRVRAFDYTGNLHGPKFHYEYTVPSADVLNRGLSNIESGVIASGGGGHSGLHPIEAGYIS